MAAYVVDVMNICRNNNLSMYDCVSYAYILSYSTNILKDTCRYVNMQSKKLLVPQIAKSDRICPRPSAKLSSTYYLQASLVLLYIALVFGAFMSTHTCTTMYMYHADNYKHSSAIPLVFLSQQHMEPILWQTAQPSRQKLHPKSHKSYSWECSCYQLERHCTHLPTYSNENMCHPLRQSRYSANNTSLCHKRNCLDIPLLSNHWPTLRPRRLYLSQSNGLLYPAQ